MAKTTHVSEAKKSAVKKIAEAVKNHKTVMFVSVKNLPSSQLQKIKKDLRGKAEIISAKKSVILRAIDETKISEIAKLKENVTEDMALLFSNDDGFELSAWLNDNKNPIGAKQGQLAESDITIEEGPTDLVPGPVISELGALGLQIMVEEGKITIRKSKIVVKKGDKINAAAVSIFQKLGIKPFMIGLNPMAFYNSESKKVYVGVKVDKKKTLHEFVSGFARARGFAMAINYLCRETIGMIIGKAERQAIALSKLVSKAGEKKEEVKTQVETKPEVQVQNKPENRVQNKPENRVQNKPEEAKI